MRDYALVFFLLLNFPIGVIQPFYGLLVYTWVSYMYPHMLTWDFARFFPAAKLTAIAAVTGTILNRAADSEGLRQREAVAMMALWICFTISSSFALYPEDAWGRWLDVSKVIIMALVTAMFVTSKSRMRYLLLVIGLSLGFYGLKGGIFSIRTGGENMVWGPGTSIIAANNAIGLALNMALPIVWYLAQQERGYFKLFLYAVFFLAIPSIMFTYSRGSAVALVVVLMAMIVRRSRFLLLAAVAIAAVVAVPLIPKVWWDRQATTLEYEADTSAMSRIDNWKICWRIAMDHPITGAGFQFNTREIFEEYGPEYLARYGKEFDTHNVFIGILTSHGFPGLAVYLLMIGLSLLTCSRLKRDVRGRADLKWIADCSDMVQVSFLAFGVNGMFVNMEYFDLVYDLVAIVIGLKVICRRELSAHEPEQLTFESEAAVAAI